jgi:hypothetical protein
MLVVSQNDEISDQSGPAASITIPLFLFLVLSYETWSKMKTFGEDGCRFGLERK